MTVGREGAQGSAVRAGTIFLLSGAAAPTPSLRLCFSLSNTAPNFTICPAQKPRLDVLFLASAPLTFDLNSATVRPSADSLKSSGDGDVLCDTEEGTVARGVKKSSVQIQALPAVPI